MKKLLALLFIGCLSVSVVGTENENNKPKTEINKAIIEEDYDQNEKDEISNGNNLPKQENKGSDTSNTYFQQFDDVDDMPSSNQKQEGPSIQNGVYSGKKKGEKDNTQDDQDGFHKIKYTPGQTILSVKNPNFYYISPEEKKGYRQRLVEKTEAYVIDGIAQQLARPVVEIASIPIIFIQEFISSIIFKDFHEQSALADAQQKYLKTLSTTLSDRCSSIHQQDTLTGHLKAMMQEKGLSLEEFNGIEKEMQNLAMELQSKLTLDFLNRSKAGTLSQDEKRIWNMFSMKQHQAQRGNNGEAEIWLQKALLSDFEKRMQANNVSQREKELLKEFEDKQKTLAPRFQKFNKDDMTLIAMYNQSRESQKNNIYEALQLIESQTRASKDNFNDIQTKTINIEENFVRKMQQKQLKQQKDAQEKERKERARELKKQKEREERAIQKSNKEFFSR